MTNDEMGVKKVNKYIKPEDWSPNELLMLVENKQVSKIKAQRKKGWDTNPSPKKKKGKLVPNQKEYIEFLLTQGTTVGSGLTFLRKIEGGKEVFSNIDGNNRINAIVDFLKKPFSIFAECFKPISDFWENGTDEIVAKNNESDTSTTIKCTNLTLEDKEKIKSYFKNMTYNDLIKFKYTSF